MRGEPYKPLLELVKEAKDWAVCHMVADLTPEERPGKIEKVFWGAVSQNDDKACLRFLGWLLRAIDDKEFLPLLETKWGQPFLPYNPATGNAEDRVKAIRAGKLMELYIKLPHVPREPSLLETKRAVLTEIARRWKEAESEEESDRAFQFLKNVLDTRGYYEGEEEKMQNEVFRAVTDRSFPSSRLVRGFLQLFPTGRSREEGVTRILAIAIGRNTDLGRTSLYLRANRPVMGSSESAFELLERLAADVAVLDQSTGALKESMQPPDYETRSALEKKGYKGVPGDIKIAFPQLGQADVLISVKWYHNWGHFDENKGHEIFENAKKHVLKWKGDHPSVKVRLELTVAGEYAYEKEFYFKRDQTL